MVSSRSRSASSARRTLVRLALVVIAGLGAPAVMVAWVDLRSPGVYLRPVADLPVADGGGEAAWRFLPKTPAARLAALEADPEISLALALLGLVDARVRVIEKWPVLSRLYLGRLVDQADGITIPAVGFIYLRADLVYHDDLGLVRGVVLHELVHSMELRSGDVVARAWRAVRVPPVIEPSQYGFRNVYEQRAEAGEAALLAVLALERGAPPLQVKGYLREREDLVPGTIVMFRWLLSQPLLAGRAWRDMTLFADVTPLAAPWPAMSLRAGDSR